MPGKVLYRSYDAFHFRGWLTGTVIAQSRWHYLVSIRGCTKCTYKWIAKRRCVPV